MLEIWDFFVKDLSPRIDEAYRLLSPCRLCPRKCGAKRDRGEVGFCGVGKDALVSSVGPHFGEEAPLVGHGGSGTIFLAGCNLGCIFCQNYDISRYREGKPASPKQIASAMLYLESIGCHNVNLVTPTHCAPQLMESILLARHKGLRAPIVYNCGGYESPETLGLLDGFVDIYMPDMKYADSAKAEKYSAARDYPEVNQRAVQEMWRQVGDLEIVAGVAVRGLLVRHLVMPNDVAGSRKVLDFLAENVSNNTCVNVMEQYRPCFKASDFPEIARKPTAAELCAARDHAKGIGFRLDR